jgi:protein SCO1/2
VSRGVALLICVALLALPALAEPPGTVDGGASLYQLHEKLTDQDGKSIDLDVYRGSPVLVTMFYSSCQATCPLTIDTVRAVERALDPTHRQRLRVLLISFDPERDTPAALRKVAAERRVDPSRWTLAHGDAAAVRRIAAALGIQYRQLPSGEFSHASVITALDDTGAILARSSRLGAADPQIVTALRDRP